MLSDTDDDCQFYDAAEESTSYTTLENPTSVIDVQSSYLEQYLQNKEVYNKHVVSGILAVPSPDSTEYQQSMYETGYTQLRAIPDEPIVTHNNSYNATATAYLLSDKHI
jgi:hypothetical protein